MGKVLFCNLATMRNYNLDVANDMPVNGGSYVGNNRDAMEKINFHDFGNNYYYGFAEVSTPNSETHGSIHIEKLGATLESDQIDDVTIVFCTRSNVPKQVKIVGWYKHATVYRNLQTLKINNNTYYYRFLVKKENATLVDEDERISILRLFGRCNIRYTTDEPRVRAIVEDALNYINNYERIPSIDYYDFYEGGSRNISVIIKQRNRKARQECLNIYGYKCQICDFDFKDIYGEDYDRVIDVHHIHPVHQYNNEIHIINPIEDLIPVCPNCHRILHTKKRNGEYPSVNELREKLNN